MFCRPETLWCKTHTFMCCVCIPCAGVFHWGCSEVGHTAWLQSRPWKDLISGTEATAEKQRNMFIIIIQSYIKWSWNNVLQSVQWWAEIFYLIILRLPIFPEALQQLQSAEGEVGRHSSAAASSTPCLTSHLDCCSCQSGWEANRED